MPLAICKKCHTRRRMLIGQKVCDFCQRARMLVYREKNREKRNKYQREWAAKATVDGKNFYQLSKKELDELEETYGDMLEELASDRYFLDVF